MKQSKPKEARLVFVYNAESGLFNTLSDIAHKMLSPDTYGCRLCAITHGYFKERKEWRKFLETLECPVEFLHRDEFMKKYGRRYSELLPSIFRYNGAGLVRKISCDEIAACRNIEDLQKLVLKAVN